MAGLSGRGLELVPTVVVFYWNSLSLMNGILHAANVEGPVALATLGWAFAFASDVPPREDMLHLGAGLRAVDLKQIQGLGHNSVFKIFKSLWIIH